MPPISTGALVPVVSDKGPEIRESTEPSKSGKALVGIIYPPPEIRNIVDKTASFVSRNGPEFEVRIRQHEANNPRFNFLTPTDPYHTYYQHKVKEFTEGKAIEPAAAAPKPSAAVPALPQKVQDAIKAAEFVPKEPPAEFEFLADPATINAFDLDLIKLTATFVARNGRQFLTQLMTRESRNYQFDFLKPQHSNFGYFTKLVEQYTKILIPPKDMVEILRKVVNDPKSILDDVKYRVEWEKHQRRIREREEAEIEKERVAYAQIDWHDFVVVQTVDFQPHETANLPPPCHPKDVGARLLAQQRLEATKLSAQTMEMEVESGSEDETEGADDEKSAKQHKAASREQSEKQKQADEQESSPDAGANQQQKAKLAQDVSQPVPAPPNPENVVIRKDYNPKTKQLTKVKQSDQKWVISPLTGEKILADKLQEHMRFNTVDSQYYVQKEREMQDKQEEEPVFAPGMDITANINYFAERRSDIFGVGSRGAEQVMIGKKLGEDERPKVDPKAIWDGHTASVDATTKAAQSQVTIEEQIAQIHKSQGLLPDQEKERIGPKSTGGGGAPISEKIAQPPPKESLQPPKPPVPLAAPPRPPVSTPAAPPRAPTVPVAQVAAPIVRPTTAPIIPPTFAQNPTAAAFGVRPAMTATVVPVVQMTPTPVLLVQQPAISMVGGFMPARQPNSVYGGFGQPGPVPKATPYPTNQFKPVSQAAASKIDEEPSAKRQKTSEDQLVSEAEWLRMHGDKGPVAVAVQCPNVPDKPEWKLNGQTLNFTFSLKDTISSLKSRIQEMTVLPASKQKLVFEGLFVKDSQTLAFYNMLSGSAVQLQLKERGGRKK